MEGKLGQSEAGTNEVLPKLSPEKLLFLGLQLLSKNNGSKPPSAVVQPRLQSKVETTPGSPPSPDSHQNTPPSSPEQLQQVPKANNGRKRKRGENSQLSNNEKREKRKLMNRVAAQNARDRKKNYVLDLERRLAELEAKNENLQLENKSLREKTDALAAENHQLEKQLFHQKPQTPSSILGRQFDSTLEDRENLSESGSAVPLSSLQQKQILEALLAQVLMTFDSLAHLLQEYWPECDVTDSGSHDPVANVRCQSHDLEQGVLLPSLETSVVGGKTIHVEPLRELNALLGPSDPLATTTAVCDESFCNPIPIVPNFTAPLSDFPPPNFTAPCPPTDHTHCTGSDFSDFELEKLLCPFTANDYDHNSFDLESLIDA